jgi:muramoyltetrapeptide carboxypeptidase LdcA involved in peptidoglycan recycling
LKDKYFTGQKKNAVYCQNDAEQINTTLGGKNAELLVLNLAVHVQSLGCKKLPNVQQTITAVNDIKLQDTL